MPAHHAPERVFQEEEDHVVLGEELGDGGQFVRADLHLALVHALLPVRLPELVGPPERIVGLERRARKAVDQSRDRLARLRRERQRQHRIVGGEDLGEHRLGVFRRDLGDVLALALRDLAQLVRTHRRVAGLHVDEEAVLQEKAREQRPVPMRVGDLAHEARHARRIARIERIVERLRMRPQPHAQRRLVVREPGRLLRIRHPEPPERGERPRLGGDARLLDDVLQDLADVTIQGDGHGSSLRSLCNVSFPVGEGGSAKPRRMGRAAGAVGEADIVQGRTAQWGPMSAPADRAFGAPHPSRRFASVHLPLQGRRTCASMVGITSRIASAHQSRAAGDGLHQPLALAGDPGVDVLGRSKRGALQRDALHRRLGPLRRLLGGVRLALAHGVERVAPGGERHAVERVGERLVVLRRRRARDDKPDLAVEAFLSAAVEIRVGRQLRELGKRLADALGKLAMRRGDPLNEYGAQLGDRVGQRSCVSRSWRPWRTPSISSRAPAASGMPSACRASRSASRQRARRFSLSAA